MISLGITEIPLEDNFSFTYMRPPGPMATISERAAYHRFWLRCAD